MFLRVVAVGLGVFGVLGVIVSTSPMTQAAVAQGTYSGADLWVAMLASLGAIALGMAFFLIGSEGKH